MKLNRRRESTNVEDRRRMGGGKAKAGMGIGGIIVTAILVWVMGGNPMDVITQQAGDLIGGVTTTSSRELTPEEEELAHFSKQILAGTEDIWGEVFKKNGAEYLAPKMVLFTDGVQTGCGNATSQVGPFYCSADQALYIDLSFFMDMKKQLGADGDFAYAYVIAHEVGHHVEYLQGILNEIHSKMNGLDKASANRLSVRLELLADFYAGVWAHYDNERYASLEDGDIEEAINCAHVIGDDYLQKKATGRVVPEGFTHGTSAQRMKWFKMGLTTGDLSRGNIILQCSESEL